MEDLVAVGEGEGVGWNMLTRWREDEGRQREDHIPRRGTEAAHSGEAGATVWVGFMARRDR